MYFSELELYFGSASAASSAAETLYQMREGIEVDYGQPAPVIDNSTAGQFTGCFHMA